MSGHAQQLRQKNADDPDIYSTLLDGAGKPPSLVLTQKTTGKERGSWVRFKVRMSKAVKNVHARRCCSGVCAQFSEN